MNKLIALSIITATSVAAHAAEAPAFKLTGTDGKSYTQNSFEKKPALVVFLNSQCPHSKKAAPDFNKLFKGLGAGVQVIAITDLDAKAAKMYAKELKAEFPLLADPDRKIIKKFGAKFSLDMTVISGKKPAFPQIWEGYSEDWVKETLSKSGAKLPKFDFAFLPDDRQSGCQFGPMH